MDNKLDKSLGYLLRIIIYLTRLIKWW